MRIAGSNLGIAALVVLVVSEAGCMGSDRPKTVPITGHVTIDGQPPGEFGRLYFTPTQPAEGYSKRPGNGSFDVDGTYRVMSWAVDDGLVPGHYTVTLAPGIPNKTKIPPRYQPGATSGLEIDVPADKRGIDFDIEVRTK
jgi:hypothetical protein